jgi:hypothetical protein
MRGRSVMWAIALMLAVLPAVHAQSGPGGGLTIREARASRLTGVVLVRGFFQMDRTGHARLCEHLVGAPPTCGGVALALEGASKARLGKLSRSAGVAWSARPVALFGRLRHGRLLVAPNVI